MKKFLKKCKAWLKSPWLSNGFLLFLSVFFVLAVLLLIFGFKFLYPEHVSDLVSFVHDLRVMMESPEPSGPKIGLAAYSYLFLGSVFGLFFVASALGSVIGTLLRRLKNRKKKSAAAADQEVSENA